MTTDMWALGRERCAPEVDEVGGLPAGAALSRCLHATRSRGRSWPTLTAEQTSVSISSMPWRLQDCDHRVYSRNPLTAVICQLQFNPILKVLDRVADFQEIVRGEFPKYESNEALNIVLGPSVTPPRVATAREFAFRRDDKAAMTLSAQSLALESRDYRRRDEFFGWFGQGLDALHQVFGSLLGTRIGLRYVNEIDREQISTDLAQNVAWPDLVQDGFIPIPRSSVDLEQTLFANEITSQLEPGAMTVRSGLFRNSDGQLRFRLDVDRYQSGDVQVQDVPTLLQNFADDIFSLFHAAAGPALLEWMEDSRA